jgi:hypothetical protein
VPKVHRVPKVHSVVEVSLGMGIGLFDEKIFKRVWKHQTSQIIHRISYFCNLFYPIYEHNHNLKITLIFGRLVVDLAGKIWQKKKVA